MSGSISLLIVICLLNDCAVIFRIIVIKRSVL